MPEGPNVPQAPKVAEPDQRSDQLTFFDGFKIFFETSKWPGWATMLLGFIIFVPDWQSRLSFWFDRLSQVGGIADVIAHTVVGLYFGPLLIFDGLAYVGLTTWLEEIGRAPEWGPVSAWTVFLVLLITFFALGLFYVFVETSNIPEAMAYLSHKGSERTITIEKENEFKNIVKKLEDKIPPFTLFAATDEESSQYGMMLLKMFERAGLKVVDNGKKQYFLEAVEFYSTTDRGIFIAVQHADAPIHSAVLLHKTLADVGIKSYYITSKDAPDNYLDVSVAPE